MVQTYCKGPAHLELETAPRPSLQVQFSLLDRRALHGMLQLCEQHDIHLLTYGSLGGGLLSDTFFEAQPRQGIFGEPLITKAGALPLHRAVRPD